MSLTFMLILHEDYLGVAYVWNNCSLYVFDECGAPLPISVENFARKVIRQTAEAARRIAGRTSSYVLDRLTYTGVLLSQHRTRYFILCEANERVQIPPEENLFSQEALLSDYHNHNEYLLERKKKFNSSTEAIRPLSC